MRYRILAAVLVMALAACDLKTPPAGQVEAPSETAAAEAQPPAALRGTYWKLVLLGGAPVREAADRQHELHLVFATAEDRVVGNGGCNQISGAFTLEADKLDFAPLMTTKMACAAGGELESYFLIALGGVAGYRIAGNTLELLDAAGGLVVRFEATQAPPPPPEPAADPAV